MIGPTPVMFWPGLLIALALLIASAWFLVRHAGLAVLVVLSPLPGFVLAGSGSQYPPSFFDYLPGYIAAGLLAGAVAPLAANAAPRQAMRQALHGLWPALAAVLLLFLPAAFTGPAALCCVTVEISAIVVTALGAMLFSYDENFVVRINRAIEARLRDTERLDFLTQTRWGLSIGGIMLVLFVLGFFGAQKSLADISLRPVLYASTALVFSAGAFAVARNVRRALAAVLAMAPVILFVFATSGRFIFSAILLLPLVVAAMPVLFMAAGAFGFEQSGDGWQTATQRGIARFGPAIAVTTLASAGAAILSGMLSPAAIIEGIALLLGGIAALFLQPALTTMLYMLFPRRVSLEEAFRKR